MGASKRPSRNASNIGPEKQTTNGRILMTKTLHGRVHGRTIELNEDPGVAEGQEVEIQMKVVPTPKQWGDGLRRCAGALASEWTEEDDRILEEIHQERKRDTRGEIPE
jgi:hypothetical protein